MSAPNEDVSGTFGKSKPFSVSFSTAHKKPVNRSQDAKPSSGSSLRRPRHLANDESDEEEAVPVPEEVTGFDTSGAISKHATTKDKEPLVIKVDSRNNWRDRAGINRRGKNLLPAEVQAAGKVSVVETETPNMSYGLSLAPPQITDADGSAQEKEADVSMADTVPASGSERREPLTQDEIALQALIRETEGGDNARRSDMVIESVQTEGRYDETSSFRADIATRPEQSSLEAYDAVPVEEFGAALLRGMGWKEGQAIGRGNYGNNSAANQARVPQRRSGFLGIGAKDIGGGKGAEVEIGAWGKAAMRKGSRKGGDGSGSTEGVYMPVVMKSKTTGEHLTEEEFKSRQKETKEGKTNGTSGRDKEKSRSYDDESDIERDRSRRHKSSTSRRDRSRSSGAHDRQSRRYDDGGDGNKRSSRDTRRYRDRDDNDYRSRPRSMDRSHRDHTSSRRDKDHHRIRDRDRDSDCVRSDRDRDKDRHRSSYR